MPELEIVSADDHIHEPPDLWPSRAPKVRSVLGPVSISTITRVHGEVRICTFDLSAPCTLRVAPSLSFFLEASMPWVLIMPESL